jgi:hypothetical protein
VQSCEQPNVTPEGGVQFPQYTVWYKYIVPESASYTFTTTSTGQMVLSANAITLASCGGNIVNRPYGLIANDLFSKPGSSQTLAKITFYAKGGATIYIGVNGLVQADFVLSWERTKYKYNTQLDTGNHASDIVVTRDTGENTEWWFTRLFHTGSYQKNGAMAFGRPTDKKLLGDFNGDGITDFVAVRPENGHLTWWIIDRAGNLIKVAQFGLDTDRPIAGDYDGDGAADMAVTRVEPGGQKTWHFLSSKNGAYTAIQFGIEGDREMIGDYDGDGRTDVAVVRTSGLDLVWYILRSATFQLMTRPFGQVGDIPQVGDVDNDGKSDIVVFRASTQSQPTATLGDWYIVRSTAPTSGIQVHKFGQANDIPQMGDHDGDGQSDFAIFRQGTWWIDPSLHQTRALGFGFPTDRPVTDLNIANTFLGN